MWRWSSNFRTSLLTKGVPLSVTILWGIPNMHIICSQMKFVTIGPVAFFREMASTHFVKYSVATSIQIWLLDGGLIGPIKSSPQVWNGQGVTCFGGWWGEYVWDSHRLGKYYMSSHIQLHLASLWARNTPDWEVAGEVAFCLDGHHTLLHVPLA